MKTKIEKLEKRMNICIKTLSIISIVSITMLFVLPRKVDVFPFMSGDVFYISIGLIAGIFITSGMFIPTLEKLFKQTKNN